MTMQRIVVATDLSESAGQSYRAAAGLARLLDARVTLLHVDEVSKFGFRNSAALNAYMAQLSTARDLLLRGAQEMFEGWGIEVELERASGDPVEQILAQATPDKADLLVMAKRGLRSVSRLILGATSKRVLRRVRIPALVLPATIPEGGIPSEPRRYARVLAATDFSKMAGQGLRAALELSRAIGASLEVAHVLRLPIPVPTLPGEAPLLVPREMSEVVRQSLTDDLKQTAQELGAQECTPSVIMGTSVAEALREKAEREGFDLIALASHGRTGVEAVLFGSTAENVVKLAPVPVLVYPAAYLERYS